MTRTRVLLSQLLASFLTFAAVIAVVLFVDHRGAARDHREHQTEQRIFTASERHAETIVIGSNRAACERSSKTAVGELNSWWEVADADFKVASSLETSPGAAAIRRVEAEGISREQVKHAARVDWHYAGEIHAPEWRAAAFRARFSCEHAFPAP